jgi:hypothetical protein
MRLIPETSSGNRGLIMAVLERKPTQTHLRSFTSITLGSYLLLAGCALGAGSGLDAPLFAQASEQMSRAPFGWFLAGSKPANYRTGIDTVTTYNGQPSVFLRDSLPDTDGYGTLMKTIDAKNYAGKRLRFRASIKSQDVRDWAGLWMRVDKQKTTLVYDNMQSRPIKGTQPWSSYDVVLDVPVDATSISFGVLLSGTGQLLMNDAIIEPVGPETEVTGSSANQNSPPPKTPTNLDFSE